MSEESPQFLYIEVKQWYQGKLTGKRRIAPGIYLETDPALMGLAHLLLKKKFARVMPGQGVYVPPADPVAVADDDDDEFVSAVVIDEPIATAPDALLPPREHAFNDADEPFADEEAEDDEDEALIEDEDEDAAYVDYDEMNIPDLRSLMDARGIEEPEVGTGRNGAVIKRDLVAALTAADEEQDAA